jgi:anti-sigma B factor antagonist
MKIRTKRVNDAEILSLFGIANAENIEVFRQHIDRLIDSDVTTVILDFEKLEEIDSTGIGGIISLLKRMRLKSGDVRIINLRGAVKKLFELLRIDRGIDVYEDLESALK